MNEFRADLHCHSTFSDGTKTPEELIDLAIESGLKGLSITDHDTISAYPRACAYAKAKNFRLLPGVEFSTVYKNETIHVLCYGFSLESKAIALLCERHRQRREKRNRAMIEKLIRLKIPIQEEDIYAFSFEGKEGMIGRPHIALALMKKGIVHSFKEAFQKYLGEGKLAYEKGEMISLEDTLSVIHQSGGKAILAHPMLIARKRLFKELLEKPFDGLEGYYCHFLAHDEAFYIQKAAEKKWIVTGGSDYHGDLKPQIRLGCSWVNEETFLKLYAGNVI